MKCFNFLFFVCLIGLYSCQSQEKYTHLKENLYRDASGRLLMKLSYKGVLHPAQEQHWKDTIYRSTFYTHYDTLVALDTLIDIKNYRTLIPDARFTDGKYIYSSSFYQPGQRMYRIVRDTTSIRK